MTSMVQTLSDHCEYQDRGRKPRYQNSQLLVQLWLLLCFIVFGSAWDHIIACVLLRGKERLLQDVEEMLDALNTNEHFGLVSDKIP